MKEDNQHRMTLEGLSDVDKGNVINHYAVQMWANSLNTATPLPPPFKAVLRNL